MAGSTCATTLRPVLALALLMALAILPPARAQDTAADFSKGSIQLGYDNSTCNASLEGTIRYNATGNASGGNICSASKTILSGKTDHVCVIVDDGSLDCWGQNSTGQSNEPAGNDYVSVSAGWQVSCAVKSDNSVTCWGSDGTGVVSGAPSGNDIEAVEIGFNGADFACALKTDSTVTCWGDTLGSSLTGSGWVEISAGYVTLCGRKADNSMTCVGASAYYSGYPSTGVVTIGNGDEWGYTIQDNGSIGKFPSGTTNPPAGTNWAFVSTGYWPACALDTDGGINCWGGSGGATSEPAGTGYVSVATGASHACAVKDDGSISCWGDTTSVVNNVPGVTVAMPPCGSPALEYCEGTAWTDF